MFTIFLAVSLPGCLAERADDVRVPFPRVGDTAMYRVESSSAAGTSGLDFEMVVGNALDSDSPVGGTRSFEVWFRLGRDDGYIREGSLEILTASNGMARTRVDCARFHDWNCTRGEESFPRPQPWGFGSSFFQGRVAPGEMSWGVDGEGTVLRAQKGQAFSSGGQLFQLIEIRAPGSQRPAPVDQHSWMAGTFVVSSASPFVEEARTSYRIWSDVLDRYEEVDIRATLTNYVRGTGETVIVDHGTTLGSTCHAPVGPFVDGLPPGAEAMIGPTTATFQEFLAAVRSDWTPVDDSLSMPGSYVPIVWISNPVSRANESPIPTLGSNDPLSRETHTKGQVSIQHDRVLHVYDVMRTRSESVTGTKTSYETDEFGTRTGAYPATYQTNVTSLADIFSDHFAMDGRPEPSDLSLMVFQMSWGRSTVIPILTMVYAGHDEPAFTYDVISGCLAGITTER